MTALYPPPIHGFYLRLGGYSAANVFVFKRFYPKRRFFGHNLKKCSVFTQILFSDFYPLEAKSIVILYNIPQLLAVEVAVGAVACNNNYYKVHL